MRRLRLRDDWIVCRNNNTTVPSCGNSIFWKSPSLPTTALLALLVLNSPEIDIYNRSNILHVPDVNQTGRAYYTLTWEHDLPAHSKILELRSINYRATVGVDNKLLIAIDEFGGMFARRRYQLPPGGKRLAIRIEPPDHVGSAECLTTINDEPCGQGGDHELAKDVTAQFFLGWDWQQAIPDRSTGFFDGVDIFFEENFQIRDPAVLVDHIDCENKVCSSLGNVTARVVATASSLLQGSTLRLFAEFSFNNTTIISSWFAVQNDTQIITNSFLLPNIELWWPLGLIDCCMQIGKRHQVQLWLEDQRGEKYAKTTFKFGARIFETYIEQDIGRAFKVNYRRIFLIGGNWITPDATFARALKNRYRAEIALHVGAGFNALRVWGGGVAEKDEFYEICDEYGVLVYQELSGTGDNNGRWAGSYDWPLDQAAYKVSVFDTMLRLRKFASLLFIGGGNELYPSSKSPNSLARAAITQALNQSERDYIFVPSSMDGGINGGNNSEHVNSYALTPKDGPYTMLMPYHFAQRNPGLNNENLSIAFQPEIGSASAPPDLDTLSCFLSTENEPPPFHDLNISDPDWQLHRYLSFSTQIKGNILYNHAYAYADDNLKHISLSDWLAYTKLAQHQQYQLLISSFFSRLFHFYTAVFIWKTQSPWPALRGFLYDFYKLRVNGGWRGIQAAAFALRSVYISNLISLDRCTLVNRANDPWTNISLRYDWFSIVSPNFSSFGNILTNHISVPPTSVLDLPLTIQQPLACLPPCLLRLTTSQGASASWYWRSLTTTNGGFDFSAFGLIRRTRRAIATFSFMNNTAEPTFFEISVPSTSPESLFYPEIVLENQSCHAPYYAVIPHYDDILLIQPGSVVTLSLALLSLSHNEEDDDEEYPPLHFTLEAWNLNIIQSKVAATTTS